jgi:hypothetical protein
VQNNALYLTPNADIHLPLSPHNYTPNFHFPTSQMTPKVPSLPYGLATDKMIHKLKKLQSDKKKKRY